MNIGIFEPKNFNNFSPINLLRPTYEIFAGMLTFRERIFYFLKNFIQNFEYYPRNIFKNIFNYTTKNKLENIFLINPLIKDISQLNIIFEKKYENNTIFLNKENSILCLYIYNALYSDIFDDNGIINPSLNNIDKYYLDIETFNYVWEIIEYNEILLNHDIKYINLPTNNNLAKIGNNNIFVGENSIIFPNTIFDTRKGDIVIGNNVEINGFTSIEGPAFIGNKTILHNADIRSGTSIGENCRISGEVASSIFCSKSNKAHTGFIGHSYISEWVNLGAMTTNSNLKNNYSTVKYYLNKNNIIDSKLSKSGAIIGDHTKLGICSIINTGSIFGIFCNLFGGKMLPKRIENFTWGDGENNKKYEINKAIETAKIVMSRRNEIITDEYINLVKILYNLEDSISV